MSVDESRSPTGREPVSHTIAGFLAAASLFAGLVAVVYYPGRLGPAAIFFALLAATMGGFQSRLAAVAVGVATVGWVAGMIVAVFFERPIF